MNMQSLSRLLGQSLVVVATLTSMQGALCGQATTWLRFNNGRITFPHNGAMNTGAAVTIEGWVRAGQDARGEFFLFNRYGNGFTAGTVEHKSLMISRDGTISVQYNTDPWAPDQNALDTVTLLTALPMVVALINVNAPAAAGANVAQAVPL